MGSITRSFANNITTSGILLPASLNNASLTNVTAYNVAIATGNMVLISSQTASNSASISFTTGIDSTYKEYQFWFADIHARTDGTEFSFNLSTDSGSNYNVTKTSTFFANTHGENDAGGDVSYKTNSDLAQSTGFQLLNQFSDLSSDADHVVVGSMSLFNPASTTYVKHYIAVTQGNHPSDYTTNAYIGGYANTTSAINGIQFKMSSGNFDGTILMYGIK
jgi:hypothetical protein